MSSKIRFTPGALACDVAVLIVTFNSEDDIRALLDDVRQSAEELRVRAIVVDNDSTDATVAVARDHADDALVVQNPARNAGFAGGINEAMNHVGETSHILILNPDLRLRISSIKELVEAVQENGIGAAVPWMEDSDGRLYPSLRQEPRVLRTLGDSILGNHWRERPGWCREGVHDPDEYTRSHPIDWATGAALLVRAEVARQVGPWDERFFLYSEEVDYCRRIRELGWKIQFVPQAVVVHRGGGSGSSHALETLMAVNKVRYIEKWHSPSYALAFRAVMVLSSILRWSRPGHRHRLSALVDRAKWADLPRAMLPARMLDDRAGAVIVPAHNEEACIAATLSSLSGAASRGAIELIVVANACTDRTVDIASSIPGVAVIDIPIASKAAALNAGNDAATLWPRLFLDADIRVTETAVADTFSLLAAERAPAARPTSRIDSSQSTWVVRRFYRCRSRIQSLNTALWGAGAYALSREGALRAGEFPELTADDLWIDLQFDRHEIAIVPTEPTIVTAPKDAKNLIRTLKRVYRSKRQLPEAGSAAGTANRILRSVNGPRSACDAITYAAVVIIARLRTHVDPTERWERDDSSRSP